MCHTLKSHKKQNITRYFPVTQGGPVFKSGHLDSPDVRKLGHLNHIGSKAGLFDLRCNWLSGDLHLNGTPFSGRTKLTITKLSSVNRITDLTESEMRMGQGRLQRLPGSSCQKRNRVGCGRLNRARIGWLFRWIQLESVVFIYR